MNFTFDDVSRDLAATSDEECVSFSTYIPTSRLTRASEPPVKGKTKAKAAPPPDRSSSPGIPDRDVVAAWRRGDNDLEPSAKMLALVRLLKEADAAGDKTIVYSQCLFLLHFLTRVG